MANDGGSPCRFRCGEISTRSSGSIRHCITAQTYGGRLESGWRFGAKAFGWTPYAALEAIGYSAPAYGEMSNPAGGAFGLSFAAKSSASVRTELGVRLDGFTRVSVDADLITFGRLAWAWQANIERSRYTPRGFDDR